MQLAQLHKILNVEIKLQMLGNNTLMVEAFSFVTGKATVISPM